MRASRCTLLASAEVAGSCQVAPAAVGGQGALALLSEAFVLGALLALLALLPPAQS